MLEFCSTISVISPTEDSVSDDYPTDLLWHSCCLICDHFHHGDMAAKSSNLGNCYEDRCSGTKKKATGL